MDEQLRRNALEFHRLPKPGKIEVNPTKPVATQRDLALAYSPGVAAACEAIVADPAEARNLTVRGNLVAVITNGTAVLGLGAIGPLAAKPVMEGKGVLFKKFAGIDVFDLEIDERDPDKLVDMIAALEPTFGGINLEDIKAPECFYIERKLRERMKIPVFHDDQHGTAIIVGAAVLNGLHVVDKAIGSVRVVCSGAGAAAIACLDLLAELGVRRENVLVIDSKGVIHTGRDGKLDESKARYARETGARTLGDAIDGADIFLGLSTAGVLKPEMVARMAPRPIILALANPEPEIRPEVAKAVRPDVIIATGRSDYPNQVNNVLCFPFIFRGALDVSATTVTEGMKLAAVRAIADLARTEPLDLPVLTLNQPAPQFGPDYLIPSPFDPRLIERIAPAVARAAMDDGVATRPIADMEAYRQELGELVHASGIVMKPLFAAAKKAPKRVVYADGEDERVLRAAQAAVDEGLARPILIGRPEVIATRLERLGLRIRPGDGIDVVNQDDDPRHRELWREYHRMTWRRGVTEDEAKVLTHRNSTVIAAMLVHRGDADAMLCGLTGRHRDHVKRIHEVIGLREGVSAPAAMNLLILPRRTLFICDTYVNYEPDAEQVAGMTLLAAEELRRFGITPRVALLSHSSFGSADTPSAVKMRRAAALVAERAPDLEIEGEMHGDAALSEDIRSRVFPLARLTGNANLLVMPNLDAANITFNVVKTVSGGGLTIGPMLLGTARPAHVLTSTTTVRRILNLTALAVVAAAHRG